MMIRREIEESRRPEAYLEQYVEGRTARGITSATLVRAAEAVRWLDLSGEPARLRAAEPACRLVVAANSRLQQKRS
jgi:hypothetical protein